jgi:hypothetical protein
MPTPFPFNRVSVTPVLISERLLPIINNTIQGLLDQSIAINRIIENIPTNVNCNDADIKELRNRLESLLKILNTTNDIVPIINTILSVLQLLVTVGSAAATAATIVTPTAGGVVTAGQAAGELAANAGTVVNLISFSIKRLISLFPSILLTVQQADKLLNDLCNETNNNSDNFINNLTNSSSANIVVTTSPFLSAQDLLDQYPSEFYNNLNVSDDDLNNRYQTIVKLIDDGFDVINNLVELPTAVLTGQGAPASTVGVSGDFYINTQNNELFGPKPTNESWT